MLYAESTDESINKTKNKVKDDNIRRDKLLLDLMMHVYDEDEHRIELIDSKNGQMIILVSSIITLESTLFLNFILQAGLNFNSEKILLFILIISLFYLIHALFYFIKAYEFKRFKQAPNVDYVLALYDKNFNEEKIFKNFLENLPKTIDVNKESISKKIAISKTAFSSLKKGVLIIVLFVIVCFILL